MFAALSYLEGKLIYRTKQHTHVEWLRFLKQIDRETPEGIDLHLIADNYCTHKHGTLQVEGGRCEDAGQDPEGSGGSLRRAFTVK